MQPTFLLRTTLHHTEQHINFTQFDNDTLDLLTSAAAEAVCTKMLKIYTRLKRAHARFWARPGELVIQGDGGKTAWQLMEEITEVAPATLNKALKWMAEQKVIAYFSGKNGVGVRIYFNLAARSVRPKLNDVRTSLRGPRTSTPEVRSCGSFALGEIREENISANAQAAPSAHLGPDLDAAPPRSAQPKASDLPSPPLVPRIPNFPDVSALARRLESLESTQATTNRRLANLAANLPTKDWLLQQHAGKVGRVAADACARKLGQKKTDTTYVGAKTTEYPDAPIKRPDYSDFWREVLGRIKPRVNENSFETWFAPLNAENCSDGVRIAAPDPVFRDWLTNNYADVLADVGLTDCQWQFSGGL